MQHSGSMHCVCACVLLCKCIELSDRQTFLHNVLLNGLRAIGLPQACMNPRGLSWAVCLEKR